jgi:hypothetical protein
MDAELWMTRPGLTTDRTGSPPLWLWLCSPARPCSRCNDGKLSFPSPESFIQSFAEAPQDESRNSVVTDTAPMPGPTETNFFCRAEMDHTRPGRLPEDNPPRWPRRATMR